MFNVLVVKQFNVLNLLLVTEALQLTIDNFKLEECFC